ncbi:hypothetical protein FQZ97_227890 [compost metagenome]
MAAHLGTEQGLIAKLHATEDEGVEKLRGRSVVITIGVAAEVTGVRPAVVELVGRRVVAANVVVRVVVPGVAADPETELLAVDHIELMQHIDALGYRAAGGEVAVAVVVVEGVGQLGIGAFHPLGIVQLDRVVETHGPVLAPGVELEGMHRHDAQSDQHGRGQEARPQAVAGLIVLVVHPHTHSLL